MKNKKKYHNSVGYICIWYLFSTISFLSLFNALYQVIYSAYIINISTFKFLLVNLISNVSWCHYCCLLCIILKKTLTQFKPTEWRGKWFKVLTFKDPRRNDKRLRQTGNNINIQFKLRHAALALAHGSASYKTK